MSGDANMRDIACHLTPNTLREIVIDLTVAMNQEWRSGENAPGRSVLLMRDFCVAYLNEEWPEWNTTEDGKQFIKVPEPIVTRTNMVKPEQGSLL